VAARIVPTTGKSYRVQRLKGFHLYGTGMAPADIARQLGVSAQAITKWRRQDHWDRKLEEITSQAIQAADFATNNVRADALIALDKDLLKRIEQLRDLCDNPKVSPGTRLGALREWFALTEKFRQSIAESEVAKPLPAGITITGLHVVKPSESAEKA